MQTSARALGSRYQLTAVIGSGAMGQVWRAQDRTTGQPVAAKLLRPELSSDPVIVGRFVQERAILLSLDHPNVVRVRDLVVEGADLAMIMDLIDGADARHLLRQQGTLEPAAATGMVAGILDGLAAAHARGILHRDVKPENILLGRYDEPAAAKLTDFSIARLAQETTVRLTGVLGTAEYIAPEVFTAEEGGAKADVYGAGITLYELLAGRTPFGGSGSDYAVANRHVAALPPRIAGLPAELEQTLASMLAKSPDDRPSASAAAAQLRHALPALAGMARLAPASEPVEWDAVGTPPPDIRVRGYRSGAPAPTDPKATTIRADRRVGPEPSAPVAGGEATLASPARVPSPDQVESVTVHAPGRRGRPRVLDVVEEPAAETERSHRRRVKIAVIAGVTVVAMVAVIAALHLRGRAHRAATSATTVAPPPQDQASLPAQPLVVGGSISRSATYTQGKVTVTIAYQAPQGSSFSGPFFEDLQSQPAGCPNPNATEVQWNVAAQPDPDGRPCGWAVEIRAVSPGESQSASVSYLFTMPPHADPGATLSQILSDEQNNTASQLQSLGASISDYAVQRLQSLDVSAQQPLYHQIVDVRVSPVWVGSDGPDPQLDLYNSTQAEPFDSMVIEQLIGQSKFPIQPDPDRCDNGLNYTNGTYTFFEPGGTACVLDVTFGGATYTSNPINLMSASGA